MKIEVAMKLPPELDPEFVPAALWNREYRRLAAAAGERPLYTAIRSSTYCLFEAFDS